MNLSEEQYEVIEAYLTNELSAADRALFESDMLADAELQAEVNRQRDIRLGLRALGIERALERAKLQYKATIATPEATPDSKTAVRPLISWRYWAAAASVILVLGLGYYTYQQTTSRQTDVAYAETFSPDSSDELVKDFPSGTFSPDARTQLLDALATYKSGKYDQVIAQLSTLPADKKSIHYKNYFLGLSYLANKQPKEAIPLLNKALSAPSAKIRQKSEWFLALAYVKNGQKEKALPILKTISTDKANPFQSLAKQVVKKIE
ncbi:hypothetical protein EXU85_09810 [Spirosoma sp. KCTC 42546]|uniref:hypothetical protein n=1 Tax=Spirosoma sp. KCTC 42546 TaxID=2520506 RepID=UPI00115BBEB1|nr:hypothetical protein [Spirosoma sp. KCTC 42546]QDK78883.1 hypothetical protein EXU85_09810 [Spirosoma sp. KCTC 42546]